MNYIRLVLEILAVIFFFTLALFFLPFPYRIRVGLGRYVLHAWAVVSTWIFGIRIEVHGDKADVPGGTLVIANHMSYFDIFALAAEIPSVYLSKKEIFFIPFLGWGAYAVGVVFVNRGDRKSAAESIEHMVKRLKQKATIIVFPEGTTTDVEEIRSFKKGAFQTAVKADIPVQVVALSYEDFANEKWKDEGMGAHAKRNARKRRHAVHMVYGKKMHFRGMKVADASARAQQEMERVFAEAKKYKDEAEQQQLNQGRVPSKRLEGDSSQMVDERRESSA